MVLSGAGDALGYRGSLWEYCPSGPQIQAELAALGGLAALRVAPPDWPVSDDTVLHLATAEALATGLSGDALLQELARRYVEAMGDMEGRKPGPTSILGTSQLRPGQPGGHRIPFNPTGTGCGAAMRAMAIGLRYPRPTDLPHLIRVSVESGRMTHHHPTGYLGALAAALLTALAVQGVPPEQWGARLLQTLPLAQAYVRDAGGDVAPNMEAWADFPERWARYLAERGLATGSGPARFPEPYGPAERDVAYTALSLDGWAGRSGHDAPMIAYDALLGAGASWDQLCARAAFHGGDSDSTAVIAGCWWGVTHGLDGVPPGNHAHLEYRARMVEAADRLHALAWGSAPAAGPS
ncbi:protein ADP-ribosylarginine hydrolase [Alligator mississippiensis]|uniref:Protein ADP-ribosylarginine hydrolase n=2 Tax=Alligator mississippiensis TaxID=8496 RepID=A0A151ML09_ALLMI|nr:protein ADP-ribosylarginine hydrolase [Alligator mississippiensis]